MAERKFRTDGADLISCDQPCGKEFAMSVEGSKSTKDFKNMPTKRCVASGASLRGQHFVRMNRHILTILKRVGSAQSILKLTTLHLKGKITLMVKKITSATETLARRRV